MNRTWIIRIGAVVGVLALLILVALSGPVRDLLRTLLRVVVDMGPWGAVLLVGLFVASTLLVIPTPHLTIGAGFLFGPLQGLGLAMGAVTLGSLCTHLFGRMVLRRLDRPMGFRHPKWTRMIEGVNEGGFGLLILLRMSYIFPYTWMNYAIAMTRASLRENAVATFIGMLPMIWLQVYTGSLARNLTAVLDGGEGLGVMEGVILGVSGAISVGVMIHVAKATRRRLGKL